MGKFAANTMFVLFTGIFRLFVFYLKNKNVHKLFGLKVFHNA